MRVPVARGASAAALKTISPKNTFAATAASKTSSNSSLRWDLKTCQNDDKNSSHAALKTIAAFLNTGGGDLLLGVADDGTVLGIEHDRLETDDKSCGTSSRSFRTASATARDVHRSEDADCRGEDGVSRLLSAEPGARVPEVEEIGASVEGDFLVRSGPRTDRLKGESVTEYVRRTRFGTV